MQAKSTRLERVGERLVILGTVHVDPSSVAQVGEEISRLRPEVVCLELDPTRFRVLIDQNVNRKAPRERPGWSGFSVLMMAFLERFAGNLTGSSPGREMLRAAQAAQQVGARVVFIDVPIEQTVGMIRRIPVNERVKLVLDSIASLIVLPFGGKEIGDLADTLVDQLDNFRKRYPELSKLLIDNREEYMANQVRRVLDSVNGVIVVVVGLGHMTSLARKLQGYTRPVTEAGYSTGATWTVGT